MDEDHDHANDHDELVSAYGYVTGNYSLFRIKITNIRIYTFYKPYIVILIYTYMIQVGA